MCDICDGMTPEQFRRRTLARIAHHDYTMIGVEPEPVTGGWSPGYVYSIGLWTFRQVPEVVVAGAPPRRAALMIEAYADAVATGWVPTAGGCYDCLVPVPVVFERVAECHYDEWLAMAFDFYPNGGFPALQMLWPGADGAWPWEAARPAGGNVAPQPLLTWSGRPESFDPGLVPRRVPA